MKIVESTFKIITIVEVRETIYVQENVLSMLESNLKTNEHL